MAKPVLRLPNTITHLQHLIPELNEKFTLEQAMKVKRGSRGIGLLFL
jgi:hypothetical protein